MKLDRYALLRDTLLLLVLWSVSFYGSVALGLSLDSTLLAITVLLSAGFCLSGCLVRRHRLAHLSLVTVGVWVGGLLVGLIQGGVDFPDALRWLLLFPVTAAIGGGLSLLLVRTPRGESSGQPIDPPGP